MVDISIAYLERRLSGGSGNTDPDASLGGDMSATVPAAQSATAPSNITGVTIDYAAGNAEGNGTLAYTDATESLTWAPNGFAAGDPVYVGEGGKYAIFGEAGEILVTVVPSALPVANEQDAITIATLANEVWDDVSKAESFAGDAEYRCIYVTNTHDADSFLMVSAYIATQPEPGTIAIGADPAGVGDGVTRSVSSITRSGSTATVTTTAPHGYTTGQSVRIAGASQTEYNGVQTITVTGASTFTYAVTGTPATPATGTITAARGVPLTVANENTAPVGVTFSEPSSVGTAIDLGALAPGESVAYWQRRTITARNVVSNEASLDKIALPAFY